MGREPRGLVAADVRRLSTIGMVRERVSLVTAAAAGVDLVARAFMA
jgi:hypothetical protein